MENRAKDEIKLLSLFSFLYISITMKHVLNGFYLFKRKQELKLISHRQNKNLSNQLAELLKFLNNIGLDVCLPKKFHSSFTNNLSFNTNKCSITYEDILLISINN